MKKNIVDGNFAAANIAYMFNDFAYIYPITPSSPMAENCDQFVFENKKNLFGNNMKLIQMQSEAGVAGAVHGALIAGGKTTTFTSSQGLLLMIPNMYKIAGEGLPCVFYVASRAVASHALNIFCDHSDIYSILKTGFNIVACSSVQEVNDMAIACEIASLKSKVPYVCFFDGFRTSHELNTIEQTELTDLKQIVDMNLFKSLTENAMNNDNPFCMGTNQNPDVFMQNRVASCVKYGSVVSDFNSALALQEKITHRHYETIEYFGDKHAKSVVVAMGSGADVLRLMLKQSKEKIGVVKIRMLKPFDQEQFVKVLPKSVKNITVLERNLDAGGTDTISSFVLSCLYEHNIKVKFYSGCYGLGGKEFTPDMAHAVFENMKNGKTKFTVGINDDVSNSSLKVEKIESENEKDFAMRVYGLGSDGSVSSVKNIIKILGESTNKFVQGYFDYDSKKSGSLTISHMRMSEFEISAPFNPRKVDIVMCNNQGYIEKYDLTTCLKRNGILILNTSYNHEILNKLMPNKMKKDLIENQIKLFVVDANKIAVDCGLGGKINTIMQTAMFKVSKIIDFNFAKDQIKQSIEKTYAKKGEKVVKANKLAIDMVEKQIEEIDVKTFEIKTTDLCKLHFSDYYEQIIVPTGNQKGDEIAVGKFNPSGKMPTDTTKFEKRALAKELPDWISEKCIQCGRCSLMCPHSALRPVVVDEKKKTPANFNTQKAFMCNGNYRMQVDTLNCTGCGVCSTVCPVKAILMKSTEEIRDKEIVNFAFAETIKTSPKDLELNVKGVQFRKPYFEFSGACAGCGETPYIKLATQLFGDRMLIANATGCSSIYGGTFPTCPYAKDEQGFGASWANSLFEDDAEFGFGIAVARKNLRKNFINSLKNMKFSRKMTSFLQNFLKNPENHENNKQLILDLKKYKATHKIAESDKFVFDNLSLITSSSVWIFGGDGWAYDIGFGGLDHVVSTGENVNILVLDTEVYSNTGGQTSKATPRGATAKFNMTGKTTKKKDLASMLMTYGSVYVASVCMGANPEQCVKAMVEAESFDGPSVIIAYSPCINHGYNMRESQIHAFNSVKSGYNTLFRYDPRKEEKMQMDSFNPTMNYDEFVETENRFAILDKVNKQNKSKLIKESEADAETRRNNYKKF